MDDFSPVNSGMVFDNNTTTSDNAPSDIVISPEQHVKPMRVADTKYIHNSTSSTKPLEKINSEQLEELAVSGGAKKRGPKKSPAPKKRVGGGAKSSPSPVGVVKSSTPPARIDDTFYSRNTAPILLGLAGVLAVICVRYATK